MINVFRESSVLFGALLWLLWILALDAIVLLATFEIILEFKIVFARDETGDFTVGDKTGDFTVGDIITVTGGATLSGDFFAINLLALFNSLSGLCFNEISMAFWKKSVWSSV